ncbi:MAG: bifunctional 2-C-methyl-D-erythritol 4-phosphate cytidylyltransferase/2-C-methyl-D-erythritol 2,4-cyclodiphosphate synthase [Hydrogenimonas sp.]|nr:MAG: bifunctional 2-C-methyl-D-erythritol 4-phosphate cytidylyltransferase/2-C-methyl-D-erythritol 2,4-cyclodiphosphate synthase [Hydrogenimonas sp.]
MSDLTLVLLAAGEATRFKKPVKKQWLRIGSDPLWLHVAKAFEKMGLFQEIIITSHPDELSYMQRFGHYTFVEGASTRQDSLRNALQYVKTPLVLVSDVARACVDIAICQRLLEGLKDADCAVPVLPVSDTVYYDGQPIDRSKVFRIQTPQLSRTETLQTALQSETLFTDESSAIYHYNGKVVFVEGDTALHKLTFAEDLKHLPCLKHPDTSLSFTGNGFDVHAFEESKPMVLGGVEIDAPFGFKAHSDGDVAIHALIDALLGAAGMGDIGELFPDTDATYAGADSKELLKRVVQKIHHVGFDIIHADITIMAQTPKLAPYKVAMAQTLANILDVPATRLNVKATTTERLGFVGRQEGVAVSATATLKYFDWTQS